MESKRIDEAFAVFGEAITAYTDIAGEIRDDEHGIRMTVEEMSIETPIELDLHVADDGSVTIGCAPPLYRVAITVLPVYHTLKFHAVAQVSGAEGDDHG